MTIVWEGVGDIFQSKMQTLVNPVNTAGVMGKGLALEFKRRYPEYFKAYRRACARRVFQIEKCFVYNVDWKERKIYSFPTKSHWSLPSRWEWIDAGLLHLTKVYEEYGITSLAIPALGCGNGQLDWKKDVQPLLHKYCEVLPIDVEIYQPTILREA